MQAASFHNPTIHTIARFLATIGLAVKAGPVSETTIVPGIEIIAGTIVIDEARTTYPGDILHEAGHLAVIPPSRRATVTGSVGNSAAEEMAAIAWSYAAACAIDLDISVVFHQGGYGKDGDWLVEAFTNRQYIGLPMLQWLGLTADANRAPTLNIAPYPHMITWLRTTEEPE